MRNFRMLIILSLFMLMAFGMFSCEAVFKTDGYNKISGNQSSNVISNEAYSNDSADLPDKGGVGSKDAVSKANVPRETSALVNEEGSTVSKRFKPPEGYERTQVQAGSFEEYLRNLPLKPYGSKVNYYNGIVKNSDSYESVIDIDIGTRDLMQCADSIMRLRAEYLYAKKSYERISFNFNNGFTADYEKWMNGYRIKVSGNNANWFKKTGYSNDYASFRDYMNMIFAYSGTLSLSKELEKASVDDIRPGDVFIEGGSPGHAIIVLDTAVNNKTGRKLFMLAQGYMPAQDIHILKNPENQFISPWYEASFGDELRTPDWSFSKEQLRRFCN